MRVGVGQRKVVTTGVRLWVESGRAAFKSEVDDSCRLGGGGVAVGNRRMPRRGRASDIRIMQTHGFLAFSA